MKALVTGGTGFIGSHLCEELVKRGYDVVCLSRDATKRRWLENLDVRLCTGDCTDMDSLIHAAEGVDYVFHIAGLTKSVTRNDFFCINTLGTENLLKAVSERNPQVKRFIYLSSLAAAGPSRDGSPVKEDAAPHPVSAYGQSKLEAEKTILKHRGRIPITILRPPAVYGPRDRDMLVMFRMIKKGVFFDLGKCYYSLLYVDDLIQGIILCAESKKAEDKIYFLSDSMVYTGEEIAMAISSALDVKAFPLKIPKLVMPFFAFLGERLNRQGIINRDRVKDFRHSHWICDPQRVREDVGFIPQVGLKEGIKWTADWYRIHRWL